MSDYMKRTESEYAEEWLVWINKIPALKFPPDWEVKIIPPFGGAIARFTVDKGDNSVSVYLDCYDKLGYFGSPYWEIHPYDGDVYRTAMENSEDLIEKISESLAEQSNI